MSGAFCSAGVVVVVGVATEKPAPTFALQSASLTSEDSNLSIIYLFWGPAWIQRSRAFRWQLYRNLVNESNSLWLDPFFSVLLEAPECPTEKLWSTSAPYCWWQLYNHESVDCRWLLGLAYSNIWCSSLTLLSSLMEWQHLVGVVQRNQPCLRDHAVCEAAELARTYTHPLLQSRPVGYSKLRVPFLFPL